MVYRETRRVPIADGTLTVEIRGAGPELLFLHGLSAHRNIWTRVAHQLEGEFRLYLPDLLSRGDSDPRPEARYSLSEETRRAEELATALGIEPRVVVGHSQGAAVALSLAARNRHIRGLVLANPVTPWTIRPPVLDVLRSGLMRRAVAAIFRPLRRPLGRRILARVYGPGVEVDEETIRAYVEPYADPRRTLALMRLLADWEPSELDGALPGRPLAVELFAGGRDSRVDPESVRALAERLDGMMHLVRDSGHVLPDQAPRQIADGVRRVHEAASGRAITTP